MTVLAAAMGLFTAFSAGARMPTLVAKCESVAQTVAVKANNIVTVKRDVVDKTSRRIVDQCKPEYTGYAVD
jgi:hypothetical protein